MQIMKSRAIQKAVKVGLWVAGENITVRKKQLI